MAQRETRSCPLLLPECARMFSHWNRTQRQLGMQLQSHPTGLHPSSGTWVPCGDQDRPPGSSALQNTVLWPQGPVRGASVWPSESKPLLSSLASGQMGLRKQALQRQAQYHSQAIDKGNSSQDNACLEP